jgi:hypothetical protein
MPRFADPDPDRPIPPATRRSDGQARLLNYRPWSRPGSLIGHADVAFGSLQILRIPLFRKADSTVGVGVPSCPELGPDGRVRTDDSGKRLYWPLVTFADADARERWQRAVLGALDAAGVTP